MQTVTEGAVVARPGRRRQSWISRLSLVVLFVATLLPLSTLSSEEASAYTTYNCRQPFLVSGGVRKIRFSYFDTAGYATASPYAAGRWNNAMGPPQKLVKYPTGQETLYSSQLDAGRSGYEGITYLAPCSNGFWTADTNSYLNEFYTDGYSGDRRITVLVHEIGHGLGLGHNTAHGNCAVTAIMYLSASDAFNNCGHNAPRPDDVNGVNAIY